MRFEGGGPARLRVVPPGAFVEALVRGTGSAPHVRWLSTIAADHGGLGAVCKRCRTEEDLYAALGLPYAPPELRERSTRTVPELVAEVRGIFHVHTTWSDGAATITDMARAARDAGFAYAGITEHSKTASYAGGLDATQLARQARAIARARREVPGFAILHGVEVDVLPDGSLDLDDATLASLDFVIASVHARLDMRDDEMTARLLRAVSHPLVTILGHPTGGCCSAARGLPSTSKPWRRRPRRTTRSSRSTRTRSGSISARTSSGGPQRAAPPSPSIRTRTRPAACATRRSACPWPDARGSPPPRC